MPSGICSLVSEIPIIIITAFVATANTQELYPKKSKEQCVYFTVLQHEIIPGVSKDQEALLIALKRPIIFILPAAFDKGKKFSHINFK